MFATLAAIAIILQMTLNQSNQNYQAIQQGQKTLNQTLINIDTLRSVTQTQKSMNKTLEDIKTIADQSNRVGNLTTNLQFEIINKLTNLTHTLKNEYASDHDTKPSVYASITSASLSQFREDNQDVIIRNYGNMTVIPDENISSSIPNGSSLSGSISSFGGGVTVIQP